MKNDLDVEQILNKKIVIFGTGSSAKLLVDSYPLKVAYYVDNDNSKWGTSFLGLSITPPDVLLEEDKENITIIIASMYFEAISEQLEKMGLEKNIHYYDSVFLKIVLDSKYTKNQEKIQYPKVVNYPITNKCNYRCAMCNVWKPEYSAKKDLSPNEIFSVFRQPLFKEVEHVGLSGGEPFVRKDILDVIESICLALPNLKSLSVITNAGLDWTYEKATQIKENLNKKGIMFSVQISIDGVGDVHSINRGVKNAFEKTIANFEKLKSANLINEISTTITKNNCNHLWDIYKFARDHNIYIRFRLASLIDRLYNNDLKQNFTFNQEEKLKIIKFIENIIFYYEKNIKKQMFYKSLIGQLKGEKRLAGCDYQTSKGVSLDPYGNLHFCFPKSRKIQNVSAEGENFDIDLLIKHENLLDEALTHCDSCTHDYDGPGNLRMLKNFYSSIIQHRENYSNNTELLLKNVTSRTDFSFKDVRRVSIIGWYGTETLGDKAIIGGIIDNLLSEGISVENISVLSLNPTYTQLTLIEMNLEKVKIFDAYNVKNNDEFIASQDLYIFGGGPLCDVEPLVDMLEIFMNAKKLGLLTMIYACGIGPLKDERYIEAFKKLLSYTDRLCLRDDLSLIKYGHLFSENHIQNIKTFVDPATNYIQNRIHDLNTPIITEKYVLFSFRKWPFMYADGLTFDEYKKKEDSYEKKMIELIEATVKSGYKVILMPMHNYHVGDDDREYYLEILQKLSSDSGVTIISHDYTPLEAMNYFKHAEYAVCLRFHSVVFAVTCNTPCIAIDYHYGRGKITGFMEKVGLEDWLVDMDNFNQLDIHNALTRIYNQSIDWEKINSSITLLNEQMREYMRLSKE